MVACDAFIKPNENQYREPLPSNYWSKNSSNSSFWLNKQKHSFLPELPFFLDNSAIANIKWVPGFGSAFIFCLL